MAHIDRRDFLATSLTAIGAMHVLPVSAGAAPPTGAKAPGLAAPSMSAAQFRRLIGTDFSIALDGQATDVTLGDVHDGPVSRDLEQFTVVFRSPARKAIPAGLYAVQHPDMGSFALRLDASEHDGAHAVFSLLR